MRGEVAGESPLPRVTFGVIVLNGEPFTAYCLRALYPYAHEIVVAEGAAPGGAGVARRDGHSSDGTLERLRAFQRDEDPEGKLRVVTAEDEGHPDGFWPGEKDEQSRAYAKRASGDWLWQVDVDEFYRPEDMEAVLRTLRDDPAVTAVSFRQICFWGGFDHVVDGPFLRYDPGVKHFHRLFRWGPGHAYVKHRPPTVVDERGRDLRRIRWIDGDAMARRGIRLYHYSLVFPKQVREKCAYYARASWAKRRGAEVWAERAWESLERPFRVHNVDRFPSWLERYDGAHPPEIEHLRRDLDTGNSPYKIRGTEDIERLLDSRSYRLRRNTLKSATVAMWPIAEAFSRFLTRATSSRAPRAKSESTPAI